MVPRVTVVGGGVSGLSCASAILDKLPHSEVTVISDTFTPNTTGDLAGGMWIPLLVKDTAPQDIIKWAQVGWDRFLEWHSSGEAWGVSLTPGTCISTSSMAPESWRHIPIGYTSLKVDDCQKWGRQYVSGYSFTTLFAEPSKFLPKLTEEIKRRGGILRQQRLGSLSEACPGADIVINCSGLGARTLVPDSSVVPVRGQVIRVKAPWVKHFLCDPSDESFAYILPNSDCVVLGGTCDEGDWNTEVDDATTQRILDRCCKLMPSLKEAEVLQCNVGLRPGRTGGVRLEEDLITFKERRVPVIHNYGHSGCGVTFMWGCAAQVADMVVTIAARQDSAAGV